MAAQTAEELQQSSSLVGGFSFLFGCFHLCLSIKCCLDLGDFKFYQDCSPSCFELCRRRLSSDCLRLSLRRFGFNLFCSS